MGGMSSPLSPPPSPNLPSNRPDVTAVVPTESETPAAVTSSGNFSAPTGPAGAQFGGAASMDFTDEPTVVGDSVKKSANTSDAEIALAGAATQMAGADDGFDDFDDLGLGGLDQDEATQILDQSSIAAAKLEALRAKSAQPDETEFDTLRPPPAGAGASTGASRSAPTVDDDFEVAATEPPPPGVGIDGHIPEGTLSLTDALELEFMEPDRLGRTMELDDEPVITGGAANPEPPPAPVRPKGWQQSQSGTEEDTEIVAGLTKQLEQKAAAAAQPRKSRGWLWATLAIALVACVAVGGWYAAPSVWGTSAHSDDTVAYTPVPSQETPPAGDPTAPVPTPPPVAPNPNPTVAVAPEAPPTEPTPTPPVAVVEEPAPTPPPVAPPTPPVAVAPTPTPPTPPVAPPTPTAAPATGDEARLRQALAADAENYEAMAALAEVLIARGNHEEALTLAQAAVRGRARVGRYHMIYGDARAAAGDRSGASRSWSRALETDPSLAAEVNRRRSAN